MKDTLEALSTTDKYVDLFNQNRNEISNGDPQFMKNIGLKASWKKQLRAGGLEGKLAKYMVY